MATRIKLNWIKDPPGELICGICREVAKEPHQHDSHACGKVFCKSCITQHQTTNKVCPSCERPLANEVFIDRKIRSKIRALEVRCNNLGSGCQWVGKRGELGTHLKSCDYNLRQCTCSAIVLEKEFQDHIINKCPSHQYRCPHCGLIEEYKEITTVHVETCPNVSVPCPNATRGCQDEIIRCKVAAHCSTCEYELVCCKYAKMGCTKISTRREIKKHEELDDKLHLEIMLIAVLNLKQTCTLVKITDFTTHKEKDAVFYSQTFYSSPSGYKMSMEINANGDGGSRGTHVSVIVCIQKGDNDDSLTWPFTGTVTIELLNQLENKNHHQVELKFEGNKDYNQRVPGEERNRIGLRRSKFVSHSKLVQPDKNCQYLKDDMLVFRVSVEHPNYWLV